MFRIHISADAAMGLRAFWQQIDPDSGALKHDFTDADWNTRFLGDLYQVQPKPRANAMRCYRTQKFVKVHSRCKPPAIQQFGFREVRLIDPTCGSRHFCSAPMAGGAVVR
ncbi:MAG: hypothetical protein H6643_09010 [Caldilineaceae bacterium]|nr:hypothetical protein [Caldilineaceae bacterium]